MILLLGGTTEAAPIAAALVEAGYTVLLSTATDLAPRSRFPGSVERIVGSMDEEEMAKLIRNREIRAVVDATHPYAATASENASRACRRTSIPCFAWERPGGVVEGPDIHHAGTHEEGAALACSFGRPVLLTIGVRNLARYVSLARKSKTRLVVRVLDTPESAAICRKAGLDFGEIIRATGPFSITDNLLLIEKHNIGVLVTKDSGEAGGVPAKVAAARKAGCEIVVVERPNRPRPSFSTLSDLVTAMEQERINLENNYAK